MLIRMEFANHCLATLSPANTISAIVPKVWPSSWHRQQYDRDYYQRRHSRIRQRMTAANKRHRNRNRQILQAYLQTHPCVDCGEKDPIVLEFDHVRGKKRNDVTTLANRGTSVAGLRFEVSKCEVRCANCHRRRTAERREARRSDGAPLPGAGKVEPTAGFEPANLRFTNSQAQGHQAHPDAPEAFLPGFDPLARLGVLG